MATARLKTMLHKEYGMNGVCFQSGNSKLAIVTNFFDERIPPLQLACACSNVPVVWYCKCL